MTAVAERHSIVRKILKGLGIVAAAVVLAMVGLSVVFSIAGRDIEPPDVSDLLPPPLPPVEQSENMVPVLMDATNLCVKPYPDSALANFYRRDDWDHKLNVGGTNRVFTVEEATALVDRLLATNAALFAALDVAASRPHARYPSRLVMQYPLPEIYDTDAYSELCSFELTAYQYGVLVALRARRQRECGHCEEAVGGLLRLGEMFARLSYDHDTGILFMYGPDLPVTAELVKAIWHDDISDETCVRIGGALSRWAKMRREAMYRSHLVYFGCWHNFLSLERTELYERLFPSECFEPAPQLRECRWAGTLAKCAEWFVRNYPGYGSYAFQPNRTMLEFASEARADCPAAYTTPYSPEMRAQFAERAARMTTTEDTQLFRRNSLGRDCIKRGYASGGTYRFVGRIAFADEARRLTVAIARYRRKHGDAPTRLEDLVPEFLDEVPRDPFDSTRPIGYNAGQGTIHTVGAKGDFSGTIPKPNARYGGLKGDYYRYIYRIDGSLL